MVVRQLLLALVLIAAPVLAQTAGGTSPASVQAQIAEFTAPLL